MDPMKKPRRGRGRGRDRCNPSLPAIPDEVERLRDARRAIAPWRVYRLEMPDGGVVEASGDQLIRLADSVVALADAQRREDGRGMQLALMRIVEETSR